MELEADCFDLDRRDPPYLIRRSLAHSRHEVWIAEGPEEKIDAALFLRHLPKATRIYSVASRPAVRGQGWGNFLLDWAMFRASAEGKCRLTLEADASDRELLAWYERHGFERRRLLTSYYAPGRDAWRLVRELDPSRAS